MKKLFLFCAVFFLAVNIHADDVSLSWDPVSDSRLTGYRVYWGTATRSYQSNAVVAASSTTYIVTSLGAGTWYFAVKAFGTGAESDFSNEVSKTITVMPPPSNLTITGVTASTSRWSTIVQWSTNLDASCKLLLGTSSSNLALAWQGSGFHTSHSATLESLRRKTTYYYRVESITMDGRSAQSAIASFRTP